MASFRSVPEANNIAPPDDDMLNTAFDSTDAGAKIDALDDTAASSETTEDGNSLIRTHSSFRQMWPKDHYEPAHVFPDKEPCGLNNARAML
eukprot:SAG11_NODE_9166_length_936_cov_1.008363_1_plen_91_part_00